MSGTFSRCRQTAIIGAMADEDLVAVGGDLKPANVLAAYRAGMFPMPLPDGMLGWWSPVERAILPLDALKVSRSLGKSLRRYRITFDQDCARVIAGCADPKRPNGWITDQIAAAYLDLHQHGWVHSVEAWDDFGLVGGLYGVAIGGLFAGESMFSTKSDASKVALVHLVEKFRSGGGLLLDVQWLTPHLASLGAVVVGRDAYLRRLPEALVAGGPWR
jgi:leucyl/phenylalanyl-tRNA--protein transferase